MSSNQTIHTQKNHFKPAFSWYTENQKQSMYLQGYLETIAESESKKTKFFSTTLVCLILSFVKQSQYFNIFLAHTKQHSEELITSENLLNLIQSPYTENDIGLTYKIGDTNAPLQFDIYAQQR